MEATGVYVKEMGACRGESWDGSQTVVFEVAVFFP